MCKDKECDDAGEPKPKTATKTPGDAAPPKASDKKAAKASPRAKNVNDLKAKADKISAKVFSFFSGWKSGRSPSGKPPRPLMSIIIDTVESWKPKRPMKFPYTFGAKIIQFPYMFYFKNNWMWRYYPLGVLMSMPVFMYISSLANSPENVARWKEIRRKEMEGGH